MLIIANIFSLKFKNILHAKYISWFPVNTLPLKIFTKLNKIRFGKYKIISAYANCGTLVNYSVYDLVYVSVVLYVS
jgi:hypothetical protein